METIQHLVEAHGYWLLFVVGFAEYAGVPIASVPVLVVGGAVAAGGDVLLLPLIGAAALGGLLADAGWFQMSRRRGDSLVNTVCGLTSNPGACACKVAERVRRIGPLYILPSKFIPGTANLAAASAGLACVQPLTFLLADATALILWASVYASLGYVFADRVEGVLDWAVRYSRFVLLVMLGLVLAASAWRVIRVRMHTGLHRAPPGRPRRPS